ncbi:hypothetical protein DSCW_08530 [Desulfosarcina widdelii]|uniref:GemA protein n=1 Tax=Desulfosarcina widdelii TaxID=947919 RepID=A0A5K7YVT9_9BACT|nr:regulatory protein GemA [Desulfosarcina widdelii]BBO73436.1 hypothetical protein DSCW_08530 [Desulfosarcina widdelii]
MTTPTISNGKKSLLHVAKSRLGLSDVEYLDILANHGNGAQSSRDLNDHTFESVLDHFKSLGFVPKNKFYRPVGSKQRLLWKIAAILKELKRGDDYADSIAERMFKVQSHRWLDADQLRRLVASLTYHQKRKRKRQS